MPNKKRIRQLAAAIELAEHDRRPIDAGYTKDDLIENGKPDHFNMVDYYRKGSKCGTVGCIGGFCVALFSEELEVAGYNNFVAEALDIEGEVADELCIPEDHGMAVILHEIKPTEAAQAVLNLLDERVWRGDLSPWHHMIDKEV